MSTVVELAELEAAIAEAELEGEEAEYVKLAVEEGLAIEAAIAQALEVRAKAQKAIPVQEAPSGEPSKTQLRELEKEMKRSDEKIRSIMGSFVAGFVACEECGGVGLVAPGPPPPRPQNHPYFIRCAVCQGFGEVLTQSIREGRTSRDCPQCGGNGYLEQLDEQGNPLARQPQAAAPVPPLEGAEPNAIPAATTPQAPAEPRYGTPAWMGDPSIGR